MPELKGAAGDRFAPKPDGPFGAALFFGRDDGLARERAEDAMRRAVGGGAFDRIDLDDASLKDNPSRLFDEALARDLFGAARAVRVSVGSDATTKAAKTFLQALDAGDVPDANFVAFIAGDLPARSALRKAFADARHAAAIPCHPDDARAFQTLAEKLAQEFGGRWRDDALAMLRERYGHHLGLAKTEMTKLLLYAGEAPVSSDDVKRLEAGDGVARADDVVDMVLSGDPDGVEAALSKADAQGVTRETVLRALARTALDLTSLAHGAGARGLDGLRPRPFGRRRAAMEKVLARTKTQRLIAIALGLQKAEADCRSTGAPAALLADRAIRRTTNLFRG